MLYLTDGELAFDSRDGMHVNRICDNLIRSRQIAPLIVIAVGAVSPTQRTLDYTPWPAPHWLPNGGGALFIRALVDTLKPMIDNLYRTQTDSDHTAIAGASLGGLLATYAAFAHDSVFGQAAAFSPTYIYSYGQVYHMVDSIGRPPHLLRFYQDSGYPDDNDIGFMEALLLSHGFRIGEDLMSVVAPGAAHGTAAWEHRFPEMLIFLFPT